MRIRQSLACTLLALASIPAAATGKLVPIEAFVERQQFSHPRLSPDGKHLAVNVRMEHRGRTVSTITVYTLPELKIVSAIVQPGFDIPLDFMWVSNQRLVVEKGMEHGLREEPLPTGEVVAVNIDGDKSEYLYGYKGFKLSSRGARYGDDYGYGSVVHVPKSRDGRVLISAYEWDGNSSMLYEINSTNSVRKLLADIPMKHLRFVVQNDGTPRFAYGYGDDAEAVLFRRDDASGEWRRVEPKPGSQFVPFAFAPDDSAVFARYSSNGGPLAIVREDLRTGQRTEIASDPLSNIDAIQYSTTREPIAVAAAVGLPQARYLGQSPDAELHKALSAQFPGSYVHFINFTDDGQKLLFSVRSDRDPGSYYLFDRRTGNADFVLGNLPIINPADMAARKPVTFAARDGTALAGYLTMPGNAGTKKLPLVLLPHGGPFGIYDAWYFDTDAQFLASRGYAVLQVNFRGSGGRGGKFEKAGHREWGGRILDDLIDGVKWATAQPEIDAARVCVYGGSFGGYAALMLPVREPAMFKCAVGYAGLYHLRSKIEQDSTKRDKQATNFFKKTMGSDPAVLDANSPTHLADRIKIPVLLVHGTTDKTTELDQAEMMRDALDKAGRTPEWMVVKNEGHGFYNSENQKRFYQRLEAFLAKHIGQ